MPVRRSVVTQEERASEQLPEWAREGAVLQGFLSGSGRWKEVASWLRVYRHVGYLAIDVAGFLVQYFACGQRWSLKSFGERTEPLRRPLAALADRREFPTPSSVSRLLGRAELQDVRSAGARLLLETTNAGELLGHPAASVSDTFGQPWTFFDLDATKKTFRERALPRGEDLPTARRRVGPDLARPGYAGRKRGELRCSVGAVQHIGSGLWVALAVSPEHGDHASMLPSLFEGVELACRLGGLARERAVLREDGAGGNVPWLTACQRQGIRYLTRWGHYALLNQEDVREALARGRWYRVASSGSGPQREALELGEVELRPGPKTVDAAGAPYDRVRSRMVVSRFRTDGTNGAGVLIDGWQYELFATDLPADAWPCAETVSQYFGRAAQENRFAQEDRELGLGRTFSYNLPGQELACLIGLMVWNLRLTIGFAQHTPPRELPKPAPRVAIELIDEPSVAGAPSQEALPVEVHVATDADPPSPPESSSPEEEHVRTLFDELDWSIPLKRLGPNWTRAPGADGLLCPEGHVLHASAVMPSRHRNGRPSMTLRASTLDCRRCPQRDGCGGSDSPHFAKCVSLPLTTAQGDRLQLILAAAPRRSVRPPAPDQEPLAPNRSVAARQPLALFPPDPGKAPGPYAPSEVRLLPANFRGAFRSACQAVAIFISVPPLPAKPAPRPLGLATTAAERQRRRRDWSSRQLDNQRPDSVAASVEFRGSHRALTSAGLVPKVITGKTNGDPVAAAAN